MKLCAIGCGEHAASSHGPAQARYAARASRTSSWPAAATSTPRARPSAIAQRFGFARSYTDPWAMLDAERPDAVVLVVPEDATCAVASPRARARATRCSWRSRRAARVAEVDRMIAAAEAADGRPRAAPGRLQPPVRAARARGARARLAALGAPRVQHVHYEMTRVDRRDPDFSTTAIHGIDAVRFLAGSDYADGAVLATASGPSSGPASPTSSWTR